MGPVAPAGRDRPSVMQGGRRRNPKPCPLQKTSTRLTTKCRLPLLALAIAGLYVVLTIAHPLLILNHPDVEALRYFYLATGGDRWGNSENWFRCDRYQSIFDDHCVVESLAGWHGLTLDPRGRVLEMSLAENKLVGQLPAEIGELAQLQNLNLSNYSTEWPATRNNNRLTGEIPAELARLTQLRRLVLGSPDSIYNQLSGEFPTAIWRLPNLEIVDLDHNIVLEGTDLSSIVAGISNRPGFTWLSLSSTGLSGTIPSAIGGLTNLEGLYLGDNDLSGQIPVELGNLRKLKYLGLSGRPDTPTGGGLSGPIPAELGRLTNLEILYLSSGSLTGEIPAELGNLTKLKYLGLDSDTGLCLAPDLPLESPFGRKALEEGVVVCSDRAIIETLHRATDGANWINNTNWLSEKPLGEWYGVTTDENDRVTTLNLPSNGLSGEIPASVGGLDYLTRVDLSGNPDLCLALDFPLESPFGREASKDVPVCSDSDREILEAFYHATDGPNWSTSTNWLNDAKPLSEWHGVTTDADGRVTELSLSRNGLEGAIPPHLGDLTNLEFLDLDGNYLVGHIPSELGGLANLDTLHLSDNHLTGQIPGELGNLSALTQLHLYRNELSGPVPASLGNLAKLEELWVSFNYGLTGQLPEGLRVGPDLVDVSATNVCAASEETWGNRIETFWPSGLICGDDEVVDIDVAVFYTPAAAMVAGGKRGMEDRIMVLAMETNRAYEKSGVHQRVAIVHAEELEYMESAVGDPEGWDTDLNRLSGQDDDFMNEVHDRRDEKGVDLVHLIRGGGKVEEASYCGLGKVDDDVYEDVAFSISLWGCDDFTFAHELGHNMGLKHNYYSDDTTGLDNVPFPYSHGYVNQRAFGVNVTPGRDRVGVDSTCWYTIMAYNDQCADNGRESNLVPYFSNPRRVHLGNPLGVTDWHAGTAEDGPADAVRSLNAKRRQVASFRPTRSRPVPAGALPNPTVALGGGGVVVDVEAGFRNPSANPLTYQVSSSMPSVARVSVSGSRVTVTPVAAGVATITVVATITAAAADRPSASAIARLNSSVSREFRVVVHKGPAFVDPVLQPGAIPLRASHFTELRSRIAALREQAGLTTVPWTDPALTPGVTPVRAAHLTELRAAVDEAYAAAERSAPRYTDPTITPGATAIKTVHMEELRAAILELDTTSRTAQASLDVSLVPEEARAATESATRGGEQWGGSLFAAAGPETSGSATADAATLRRRFVEIDVGALGRAGAAVRPDDTANAPRLVLNLFDDVVVTGIVEAREPTFSGGFALSGRIEDTESGTMTLVVNGTAVTGTVRTPSGIYWIQPVGEGMHEISQRNPSVTIR